MEYQSMGKLIQALRKEKGLTQKQLADMLNITDKAVSKWERDAACPDTTTLPKLADILGVPIDALLCAKTANDASSAENEASTDINLDADMHRVKFKQLLLRGLYGFIGGALIMGFLQYLIADVSSQTGDIATAKIWEIVLSSLLAGCFCIGFPFGWHLLNKLTGQWNLWGNIYIVVFLFAFRLAVSLIVGAFAYPYALIYHLIQSQKSKRKVKRCFIIVISIIVLFYCSFGVLGVIELLVDKPNTNSTQQDTTPLTAKALPIETLQKIAAKYAAEKQAENDADGVESFSYSAVEVYGIYFLKEKEDAAPANKNELHIIVCYDFYIDGEYERTYYFPLVFENLVEDTDNNIKIEYEDGSKPPFFYTDIESYLDELEDDYFIEKIG